MNIEERNRRIREKRAAARLAASVEDRQAIDFAEAVQEALPGGLVVEIRESIPPGGQPRAVESRVKVLLNGKTHVWTGFGNDAHEARMNAVWNNTESKQLPF